MGVAGGLREGAGLGPTAQSFSGDPRSGAAQGSELVFFPLQRVTEGFLLLGTELSLLLSRRLEGEKLFMNFQRQPGTWKEIRIQRQMT